MSDQAVAGAPPVRRYRFSLAFGAFTIAGYLMLYALTSLRPVQPGYPR